MAPITRSAVALALAGVVAAGGASGCGGRSSSGRPTHLPSGSLDARGDGSSGTANAVGAPLSRPYEVGIASWYGEKLRGRPTASGEPFDPRAMTAAHRTLPLGTWIEVRRVDTGRSVRVRINDRGPVGIASRIVDVSHAAADALDMTYVGLAKVEIRVIRGP